MKTINIVSILMLLLALTFSSCEVIGGIFKAGMGVGIFLVLAVIALIVFLAARVSK